MPPRHAKCVQGELEEWERSRSTIASLFKKGRDRSTDKRAPVLWRVCDECSEGEGFLEKNCKLVDCDTGMPNFVLNSADIY